MRKIETKLCEEKNLTIHTVLGPLDLKDVSEELDRYYSGYITKLTLWDLTREGQHLWQKEHIIALVKKMKDHSYLREGGKTAIVVYKDLDFGLSRMVQTYADIQNIAFEIAVFRDIDKAKEWLGVSSTPN